MAAVLRGDVVWADLNPVRGSEQAGLRPVLVLSADVFNRHSGTVVAVALTSQAPRAGFPLTLPLSDPKLPKKSWVKIGQVRTLSTERLGKRLARATPDELAQVLEGLNEILGGSRVAIDNMYRRRRLGPPLGVRMALSIPPSVFFLPRPSSTWRS